MNYELGVQEFGSSDISRGGSAYPPGKTSFQRADTLICPYNNSELDANNLSTRQLKKQLAN
jgi:hypothetical protein